MFFHIPCNNNEALGVEVLVSDSTVLDYLAKINLCERLLYFNQANTMMDAHSFLLKLDNPNENIFFISHLS